MRLGGVRTQVIEKSATLKSHRPKEFKQKSVNCCMPLIESNNIKNSKLPFYDAALLKNLQSSTGFIDSHCHLDLLFKDEDFHGTYSDYIARHADTYPDSYKGCVTVFCKPWTFSKVSIFVRYLFIKTYSLFDWITYHPYSLNLQTGGKKV